ncbi:hypothetical protein NMG60_11015683 [Bertholletia excelsa]
MGSKWAKAKLALKCLYAPSASEGSSPSGEAGRLSDSSLPSRSRSLATLSTNFSMPKTQTPSSSGLRWPKHGESTKSSKRTCSICLSPMKLGQGHAIFTAECSHSFHFQCITANVKHGNQSCPVCRAKWKEIPVQSPASNHAHDDAWITVLRQLPPPRADMSRQVQPPETGVFNDDEIINHHPEMGEKGLFNEGIVDDHSDRAIELKTYPEVSAIARSTSYNNFNVLIHLKAHSSRIFQNSRTPLDLVTILDVSGSMAGTKLALLKRAMGFVIQHLGPFDRLSVIAFSSTARRLFPLRRMSDTGKQEALQAINCLVSSGGTNIAEGLRKGTKVMMDRRWKNPVSSIILLSDGQDTYTVSSPVGPDSQANYSSLLPVSINGLHIPIHAFGFGADHDAASMHSISETSGGTFSFIEAESVIQDSFAQCIGGLLSVVAQELQVKIKCVDPRLQLGSIKSGSYKTSKSDAGMGFIEVGDLYADEERDFLVEVNVPIGDSSDEIMTLLKVGCSYRDPIRKESVILEEANEVKIHRPEVTGDVVVSLEVDRQQNRLRAAEAMAEARIAAEKGDLTGAVSILECCRKLLLETLSAQAGDRLCIALATELSEMQERMASRYVYESSGRAYVLSGLSSHSLQRATARGDSVDNSSLLQSYQTPSMADMVTRSQTMSFNNSLPLPSVRPARPFPARPRPR